jgi:hypothetical protein
MTTPNVDPNAVTAESHPAGLVPRRQLARAERQRDELLAAAKDMLSCANLDNRARLRDVVARIEADT